jgi:hypothetical protein
LLTENKDILIALTDALVAKGTLTGGEVDQIIADCITARSLKAENQRRADWRARQLNSAEFLKEFG